LPKELRRNQREEGPMSRVFVNYRRADAAAHANLLYDWIRERYGEDRVFKDVDSIEPGMDFEEAIERAVASSAVMLVVIGNEWLVESSGRRRLEEPYDYVRLEVGAALQRNIRVIPVLVEGAAMPEAEELPEALAALPRRQAFELSDMRSRADRDELLRRLDTILGAPAVADGPPRGWNWGAFLLTWIWGIGNGVYVTLLCLVPVLGFVMMFVLGSKGNELAWRAKRWESVEQFQRSQRKWALSAFGVYGGLIVLWILIAGAANS
jgi:TIR domain